MTQQELFKKYGINDSHNVWESADNWLSVELYRLMHEGALPPRGDTSSKWVLTFLDKCKSDPRWTAANMSKRRDWGSLYLTAKRMTYSLADQILEEINFHNSQNQEKTGD